MELEDRMIGDKPAHEVVTKRNERLLNLFNHYGINVRLIGDVEKPAIILDDAWSLSCWVRNFDLVVNDAPRGGNTIATFKLRAVVGSETDMLKDWVKNESFHRRVYRVALGGSGLYLAGHNFKNRRDRTGRYPVFSRVNPKVYYTKEKAEEFAEELDMENYNAVVI